MQVNFTSFFPIIVIAAMTTILAFEILPSAIVLAGALLVFLLTGIIDPTETLAGLSNRGMITVALLFIVAAGLRYTGALNAVANRFLGKTKKKSLVSSLFRMMVPVSFLSAFLNNTPIVVIFTPIIKKWAEKLGLSASKFLIPLSYATIFGGVCTLIGTSTNLVVHGMMLQNGIKGLSMFELGKVGLPCAIIGWIYLAFFGHKLLPERKDILETVRDNRKEYFIGMKVTGNCPIIGKTITKAGLRNLKNVYLMEIERAGEIFGPVSPDEKVLNGDVLYFVGVTSAVVDLQDIPGLVPAAHRMFEEGFIKESSHLVEAVISDSSPILGKTVKKANFREKYKAGVVAIHRNGERIKEKVGDIRLHAGDVLLLLATDDFLRNWSDSRDFYVVSRIKKQEPRVYHKAYVAVAILVLMVLAATFGGVLPRIGGNRISMFYAAAAAAAFMMITRCVTIGQAKRSLDMNVLLTIVCAFGISKALQNSGAAAAIADFMINLVKGFGPVGVLAAIYLLTTVFTEIITNNAAAVLIFPIAYSAGLQLGVDPRPFFIAIAIAASASFATPIGYQTNLIVQGAGGYKFTDYLKAGLPLNILFFIVSVIIIP
ncbi:MAG: SLC13 family permease, partial [Candidatus Omnitrophota bacterium]|nr:SLC13 family permease [Candidatus Omnitrophota bacterium]